MATQVVSLQLPNDLYDKLQFLSATNQKKPVDIVAQLVTAAYEAQQVKASTPAFQSILENATDLGVTDLSEQHDHYLYGIEKE